LVAITWFIDAEERLESQYITTRKPYIEVCEYVIQGEYVAGVSMMHDEHESRKALVVL